MSTILNKRIYTQSEFKVHLMIYQMYLLNLTLNEFTEQFYII